MSHLARTPPPGWPAPPSGWAPPPGWQPDPSWPPVPEGWQWWSVGPRPAAAWYSPDGSRRVYTRIGRRWFLIALTLFCAVIGLLGPAAEVEIYGDALTATVFVSVLLTATAVAVGGVYRMAILVEPGRVTVRRALRTHRIPAADIVRFEPPPAYGSLRHAGLRIVLRDGRVLSATAFSKGPIDADSIGRAEAAELNAWLAVQGMPAIR